MPDSARLIAPSAAIGGTVERLELTHVWLVDPASEREGAAGLTIVDGRISAVEWLDEDDAASPPDLLVMPGLTDLHVHAREPGDEDAETVASAMAAAAHGGFTRICLMPNTKPPIDSAAAVGLVRSLAGASGLPVRVEVIGATTAGRAGATLAPMAELAGAGAVAVSDDGAPVGDASLMRNALAYAGAIGLPVIEHAEDRGLTDGAEMHDGVVATILGLKGWPAAAEVSAVARALAILEQVSRGTTADARPHLHLTHLSTAAAVDQVRAAKAAGLAVTCDVTPHHLALHDGWVAGDRRWSWEALAEPWAGGPAEALPYDPSTRVNPPLRPPSDGAALAAGLLDGTIDAIATDHAPHTEVAKTVEYGDAANGIAGLETAIGQLLAAVDAGVLDLATVARALATGPRRVLGEEAAPAFAIGDLADLVVIDRSATWRVDPERLRSRGHGSPLRGRTLPGRVTATIAAGRWAWVDAEASSD